MIEALRERLARRAVRSAVASRRASPVFRPLRERVLLLVLPADEHRQRAGWDVEAALDLGGGALSAVVLADGVPYVPDRHAGAVVTVRAEDRDWRRLPTRAVAEAAWDRAPDVALDLTGDDDWAGPYLVGGAPAPVRIGRHRADAEPCYDLMLAGDPSPAAVVDLLRQIDPPLLPLAPRADPA